MHSITGTGAFNLRFPGQWFQLEAGLHYNWHRHYDPSLGRYTQPDPLGFVDGPSVYGYAGGSPLRSTDSRGLDSQIQRCGLPKRRPLDQCNAEFPRNPRQKWYQGNRYDANDPQCYQKCAKKEFSSCHPIVVVVCPFFGTFGGPINGVGCMTTLTYACTRAADLRCKFACDCLNNDLDAVAP